jgi:hypothetical protein
VREYAGKRRQLDAEYVRLVESWLNELRFVAFNFRKWLGNRWGIA